MSPLRGFCGEGGRINKPELRIANALLARAYTKIAATQLIRRYAATPTHKNAAEQHKAAERRLPTRKSAAEQQQAAERRLSLSLMQAAR